MPVAPLSVSVQDTNGQWHQLPRPSGVRFTTTAPGGPAEATIPLADTALLPDLQQGCAARISDGTTGQPLWTGRLSSPVRQVRGVLESGDPSFEGQSGYLGDHYIRYTPLVTRLDAWQQYSAMKPAVGGSGVSATSLPTRESINALVLTLPAGYIAAPYCSLASFRGFYDSVSGASQTPPPPYPDGTSYDVRSMVFRHVEGVHSSNRPNFQVYLWHGGSASTVEWSSAAIGTSQKVTELLDPDVLDDLTLGFQYNGPGTDTNTQPPVVSSDELWAGFWQIQVFRSLRNLAGERLVVDPSTAGGLTPDQIVRDLLGHFSAIMNFDQREPFQDNSQIDGSSTVIIDSYDFTDPATPADILTDLMALVPTHYWAAGIADADGLYKIYWQPWAGARTLLLPPGAVTYDESASDGDLCNQMQFSYIDSQGRRATEMLYTSIWAYPDTLALGGKQVEAPPLDLTGLASYSAAAQVAKAALGEYARAPKSATATVSVPVADAASGAMIPPWTLTAGCLAHVPETGETLRVTKVEVDADTATATLTLGTPRRTTDQIVATMSKHRRRAN